MADIGISVPFSPFAGTAESRWIRLVQVGADSQAATMDEAADLIDSLYNVSPCDTGTEGTGGEAADDSKLPDEDAFLALVAGKLGNLCEEQDRWDAQVDLLRSHQSPGNWQARSETATLLRTDIVTERQTETITLDGANHYNLTYPYHSGLLVVGADVVDVRGSTVNFARHVTGRVRVTYTTRYERLTFRVPATPGASGQAVAEPAAVIVFWDELAAQVDLQQPAVDDSIDAAELARLCRGATFHGEVRGDCWQTIEHYRRCQCSDTEAPGSWTEEVATSCPEGVAAGAHLGTVRQFDGYTGCPGEGDEDISDPEFFKAVCCHYPSSPSALPGCRKYYDTWRGGEPIESGQDYWRDTYGPDVRLIAVTPPDGICGKLIREWEVNRQNCCDDVIPMQPHPDNPTEILSGQRVLVGVIEGRYPGRYIWRAYGGLQFDDGTTETETGGPARVWVNAPGNVCPEPRIVVDDGCSVLTMTFAGGEAMPVALSETDIVAEPLSQFGMTASGGVPPYMWMAADGVELIGVSATGATALFRTGDRDEWCVARVAVVDQCGMSAECAIRNTWLGRWDVVTSQFDMCTPPGAGSLVVPPPASYANPTGVRNAAPLGGYRVSVATESSRYRCGEGHKITSNAADEWRKYCEARSNVSFVYNPADYGCEIIRRTDGQSIGRDILSQYALTILKWVCNG